MLLSRNGLARKLRRLSNEDDTCARTALYLRLHSRFLHPYDPPYMTSNLGSRSFLWKYLSRPHQNSADIHIPGKRISHSLRQIIGMTDLVGKSQLGKR